MACCPRCRLLQSAGEHCTHCGARLVPHDRMIELLQPYVESVQLVSKPPPGHGRGGGRVMITLVGMWIGVVVGGGLAGPIGSLAGMVLGATGYRKHFWRMVLVRRPRLKPVANPTRSGVATITGIAELVDQPIQSPITRRPALAVGIAVRARGAAEQVRHLLRVDRAAPFWLVVDSRKLLVTGSCWIVGKPDALHDTKQVLATLGVPSSIALPKHAVTEEVTIRAGARVSVTGVVRDEHVGGLGYRDTTIETLRGEPGAVVWIELVD